MPDGDFFFLNAEFVKEARKSMRERLQAVQDAMVQVQYALDFAASSMERVKK